MAVDTLSLRTTCPLKAQNAGLFIARGTAMHPTRVIGSHELIFLKQGELDMWEGDHTFHLEAGQVLHLFPRRQHGSSKPMPVGLKFYWIHFEIEEYNRESRNGGEFAPAVKIPQ
ncbi:MAG TPA: AraC family ligand binding domain-containing protein, partial [Phototrophicaceae bacterium]|nr:AraC family ligand binding domain-containing protein [Phototrophicaceae bacterium]